MNKKILFFIIFIILLVVIFIGIRYYINSKSNENNNEMISQEKTINSNEVTENNNNTNENLEKGETEKINDNTITLSVDEYYFEIELEQNETTNKLLELLPLEITMNDLNNNEKYYYLDEKLPTNSYSPKTIEIGDVMLYGNNCLVIFYDTFETSYSYTKIGKIKDVDNLKVVLGKENIRVKLQ